MPLLIAQSSNPKTKELEEKLYSCGFDQFIETPVELDELK